MLSLLINLTGQQLVQVDRFKLLAGQGLLNRRQLQDGAEDLSHGPVAGESLVVEEQILQSALLDGLQDKAVGAVHRSDDLNRALLHMNGLGGTVPGADAAAQTEVFVDYRLLLVGRRILHDGDGVNGTDLGAFAAAHTGV